MHDSTLVAVQQSLEHLPHYQFDVVHVQRCPFFVEVLLDIHVEVLEDEVEFVVSVNDLLQLHYALVV